MGCEKQLEYHFLCPVAQAEQQLCTVGVVVRSRRCEWRAQQDLHKDLPHVDQVGLAAQVQ